MPVRPGQLPLVALDQNVGFVSGPTVAFRVRMLGCVHFSPSQITTSEKVSLGTEQIVLPFLPVGLLMILWHLVLSYNSLLAVDISFLIPDSVTRGSPASFPKSIKLFLFFNLAGLDAGKIKQVGTIRGQESTRRIGDYKVKYGYTDIELLRSETLSFVVSRPPFLHDPSILTSCLTMKY